MTIKIAINGFGRIGRLVYRIAAARDDILDAIAVCRTALLIAQSAATRRSYCCCGSSVASSPRPTPWWGWVRSS